MKHVRFTAVDAAPADPICSGILQGDTIQETSSQLFEEPIYTGRSFRLDEVRLQAPLVPRHIIGIGKNFVPEGDAKPPVPDMPILFFKPLGTLAAPGDPILLPPGTSEVKFESEIAVVIGCEAKHIAPGQADEIIFGCTVANDVGALNFFHPEGHWTIGKSFDTFCPLGPHIETDFDYRDARIYASVNGSPKQDSRTERIIMPIDRLIAYISTFMTLMPGDVILTGTPAGADWVRDGDVVTCGVEGIGELVNPVKPQ